MNNLNLKKEDEQIWKDTAIDIINKYGMSIEYIEEENSRLTSNTGEQYEDEKKYIVSNAERGISENDVLDAQGYLRDDVDDKLYNSIDNVDLYEDDIYNYTMSVSSLEDSENQNAKKYLEEINEINKDLNNNRDINIQKKAFEDFKLDILGNKTKDESDLKNMPEKYQEYYRGNSEKYEEKLTAFKSNEKEQELKNNKEDRKTERKETDLER